MLKVYAFLSDKHTAENGKVVTNGYSISQFRKEWAELSDESKAQLKDGVENGTLTY